jgi:hypothetical protein
MTEQPVYYPSVLENSPPGTKIIHLNATDDDKDLNQKISFRIISGNPEGYFAINSTTGKSRIKAYKAATTTHMLMLSMKVEGKITHCILNSQQCINKYKS